MKKAVLFLFLILFFSCLSFAQTVNVTIEITNVVVNNGLIYVGIYFNAESFRNGDPDIAFELEPVNTTISREISIENGEYVITAYQDANNNGILDLGFLSWPKELVGLSNYFGRGFPSHNFRRQKILINESTPSVIVGLYRF
jgi:uncharacterized protein (DUF2141 family)